MALWSVPGGVLLLLTLLFTPSTCQWRDGDIRLVGGSYQWEGRVEVYMSGEWGTIADSDWTDDDAAVVCRKLGHFRPGATAYSRAYFGEGKGPVNLDLVECSGLEYNLTECDVQNTGSTTSHSLDVGVKCQPVYGSYRNGDLRLVGGANNWEGRVEIFWNGDWGAISDSLWSTADANVVCRQLLHSPESGAAIPCCSQYGAGVGDIHFSSVSCNGNENRITDCSYNTDEVADHQHDVRVQCQQGADQKHGDIRLVGGSYLWEGRLEIFLSGEWGTVCDDGAGYSDARVVCRQLGYYTDNPNYYCCRRFGEGVDPIHIEYLSCSGLEYRLNECHNTSSSCRHTEDWSVSCTIEGHSSEDVRLTSTTNGRVEVFLSGVWVAVANSRGTWQLNSSQVVCRELGYSANASSTSLYSPGYYTYSTSLEQVDNVMCVGTESRLSDCPRDIHVVSTSTAVGMSCDSYDCIDQSIRLADGESEREGRVEICSARRWGTICDNQWTINHTAVVCRFLGYSDLLDDLVYFNGRGAGPVFIDYINCTGSEGNIWRRCKHFSHHHGCSHEKYVGVQCKPARCSNGQLRLTDDPQDYRGRIEICSQQRWETFYSVWWSSQNSEVACRELGFRGGYSYGSFGYGGGPRYYKYFQCTGSEQKLSQCKSFDETEESRSAGYDMGISCRYAYCTDGEVRLDEGETAWEGRVELCMNGRWGTVGGNKWNQINSHVVCNSLGYEFTNGPVNISIPTAPSKPLYIHDVRCSEGNLALVDCGFTKSSDYDAVTIDKHAVVKCQEPQCKDGDLRLVGGVSEGRLEVCFNNRWGTIDGHGWTHTDTVVACKQLGYSAAVVSHTRDERRRYPSSYSLPTFMTLVGCYGTEERLTNCSYHKFEYSTSSSTLSTSMDVSISCGTLEVETSASRASNEARASLSISVILAVAVIVLVAVLITVLIIQRKKRTAKRDLSGFSAANPTNGEGLPSPGIHYTSNTEKVSLDNKMEMEDLPAESYEEVEAPNPLPIPPKPQPKKAQNKSQNAAQKVDSSRYARGAHAAPTTGPKPTGSRPQAHSQAHSQAYSQARPQGHSQGRSQAYHNWAQQQQQQPVRSDSPEVIYECPD